MRKIFLSFFCLLIFLQGSLVLNIANATETKVVVTEKIPGVTCTGADNQPLETRKYTCTVENGFGSVMKILTWAIKYATFIAILIAILMLVVSGIRLSVEGKKDDAKKMFSRVITAIIMLLLVGFILATVAPWVYK